MPLETVIRVALGAGGGGTYADTVGLVHGLIHNGVSRTPNFVKVMPENGSAAIVPYCVQYNSLMVTLVANVNTQYMVNVFVKKCHSVEDGAF